jgi:hypothetical protein
MDRILDCNQSKPRQIRLINYCRLFHQVHTVADLATSEGPEAWNAWRKACPLWCNDLHESLGPWKVPSVSLRRSWPLHWDRPTGRLLVRTADGYNVHQSFSGGPNGLTFHGHSTRCIPTLPQYCVPTAAIERRLGFTRLPSPELNRLSPPVPCLSFEQFITTQPKWSRRLLHTIDKDLSYEEIFQLLTCPTSFPIGVCDGSVQSYQGTFGWVLATSDPHRTIVRCSGPAYGACMDSYRAVGYILSQPSSIYREIVTITRYHLQKSGVTIWQSSTQ